MCVKSGGDFDGSVVFLRIEIAKEVLFHQFAPLFCFFSCDANSEESLLHTNQLRYLPYFLRSKSNKNARTH